MVSTGRHWRQPGLGTCYDLVKDVAMLQPHAEACVRMCSTMVKLFGTVYYCLNLHFGCPGFALTKLLWKGKPAKNRNLVLFVDPTLNGATLDS